MTLHHDDRIHGGMSNEFLSVERLQRAMEIEIKIAALQMELAAVLGGIGARESTGEVKDQRTGKRSAATRAKMAAAQKARWARKNGSKPEPIATDKPTKAKRKKHKMSAEGRARIAEAQKKRWAVLKKGK